jgi:hypothetical protein
LGRTCPGTMGQSSVWRKGFGHGRHKTYIHRSAAADSGGLVTPLFVGGSCGPAGASKALATRWERFAAMRRRPIDQKAKPAVDSRAFETAEAITTKGCGLRSAPIRLQGMESKAKPVGRRSRHSVPEAGATGAWPKLPFSPRSAIGLTQFR